MARFTRRFARLTIEVFFAVFLRLATVRVVLRFVLRFIAGFFAAFLRLAMWPPLASRKYATTCYSDSCIEASPASHTAYAA